MPTPDPRFAGGATPNDNDLALLNGAVSNLTFEYERYKPLSDTQNNMLMEQADTIREALTSAAQSSAGQRAQYMREAVTRLQKLGRDMKTSGI